jgi:hypothetical protein
MTPGPGPYGMNLFTAVFKNVHNKLVFVHDSPFEPILMFVGKARSTLKLWSVLYDDHHE